MKTKVILLTIIAAIVLNLEGCSEDKETYDYSTPEDICRTLVTASYNQDYQSVNQCYGEEVIREETTDVENIRYRCFLVMDSEKLHIKGIECNYEEQDRKYMGIFYELELSNGKVIPCYENLLVCKKQDAYVVVQDNDYPEYLEYPDEMNDRSEESKWYQEYKIKKELFEEAEPDYLIDVHVEAEQISIHKPGKIEEKKEEIRNLSVALSAVTAIQLIMLMKWHSYIRRFGEREN